MNLNGSILVIEKDQGVTNLHKTVVNPLREDAFAMDNITKIELISEKFMDIIELLGLDLIDESIKDTPKRVAKMYVSEIFKGLNPKTGQN